MESREIPGTGGQLFESENHESTGGHGTPIEYERNGAANIDTLGDVMHPNGRGHHNPEERKELESQRRRIIRLQQEL